VFAPGHLRELTRIIPFEMVDAVLADCGAVQRQVRKLSARVVVYRWPDPATYAVGVQGATGTSSTPAMKYSALAPPSSKTGTGP
jgi:hypothetical protein